MNDAVIATEQADGSAEVNADGAAPVIQPASSDQPANPPEGAAPTGEPGSLLDPPPSQKGMPEGLEERFWDKEKKEVKVAELIKSHEYHRSEHGKAAQKTGEMYGPPEGDYELTLPDGIDGEFDPDNPLLKAFITGEDAIFRKMGASQKAVDLVTHHFAELQAKLDHEAGLTEEKRYKSEVDTLGGEAVIRDVEMALDKTLPPTLANALGQKLTDADTVRAVEMILQQNTSLLPSIRTEQGSYVGPDDARAARWKQNDKGQYLYDIDANYRSEVNRMFAQAHPGDDVQVAGAGK